MLTVGEAGRLAGLLGMLADPVRSRILFALAAAGELCVGDLALALDVNQDQVSYALKMPRLAGLASFRKDGRVVFYRLSDSFPHPLLEHCLRQLLRAPRWNSAPVQEYTGSVSASCAHPAHGADPDPYATASTAADRTAATASCDRRRRNSAACAARRRATSSARTVAGIAAW